jgi:hypothetical protein
MFELKPLSAAAIESAKQKAAHFRLLNEPRLAESICRDILAVDPNDQEATIALILSLSDQFGPGARVTEAMDLISTLATPFDREYYSGIIAERKAISILKVSNPGAGQTAYDWLRCAMDHFDSAESLSPDGNDDGVLRWNTCARIINSRSDVRPANDGPAVTMLE